MAKKKRIKSGDVLKIDLGDGFFSYCQVLKRPWVKFFDIRTTGNLDAAEIVRENTLFDLCIYDVDVKSGRWGFVGHVEFDESSFCRPPTFKQDPISGRLSIYDESLKSSNFEREAKLSECQQLERTAVWAAEHAEGRLRDHFQECPNIWVQKLAIDLPRVPKDQVDI